MSCTTHTQYYALFCLIDREVFVAKRRNLSRTSKVYSDICYITTPNCEGIVWLGFCSFAFFFKVYYNKCDPCSTPTFSCSSRYVGDFCEYPNPCNTGAGPRCQNNGSCTVLYKDRTPSFHCTCPIGFTASLCEIPVKNACDTKPCQNGAACSLQSLDKYTCSCTQGYTGKMTGQLIPEAAFYLIYWYFQTIYFYTGKHCEKQNVCASAPCHNGGNCTSLPMGKFKCICPKGFKGPTCTDDVEECLSNPCRHGGTCVNTHGSYQ